MSNIKKNVLEVLHNLNWLIEPHGSYVELVDVNGHTVTISCVGTCIECETDCIGIAFKERLPHIELIRI